ncbi:uncharacterized protein PITG_10667 [Phytophthora infestans T30-4]|uniref:Uncharacterized protein n=1 Tax=Phytophthora infestans (strain T30-4) TaxID=403677 RepID=D0NGT5_PHYIT|nr:uncharacterized protein PITG_10667 [Phytophthora infestans T30-4]EEY58574.1 conserved hypothetical protein [Phytophthora infestans T30-4]|eukprot:XP_002901518.1 conserved hypothetical protein [Phytophthora infestans T30-4]
MDLALTIIDGLRQIFELRDAIRRQRHENRKMYLRMMEIYVELQPSGPLQANPTLQRTKAVEKFADAVASFSKYLQKYHDMHRVVRMLKHVKMEKRQKIASEIDQLFRTLNLAATVTVMNEQAAASSNAAEFFAKLEDMHGDIKLSHDQIHAALLADKQQLEMVNKTAIVERGPTFARRATIRERDAKVLTRQAPMKKKCTQASVDEKLALKESVAEEKLAVETKTSLAGTCTVLDDKAVSNEPTDKQTATDGEKYVEAAELDPSLANVVIEQQKERALLRLMRMCVTNRKRVQVYRAQGIPVLSDLARTSNNFFTQLYALHCLSWFTFSHSKMSESTFTELQRCVREPTHSEILSMLDELQHGDEQAKEVAALQCSCLATRGDGDMLRRVGLLPLLTPLLSEGTSNQQLWVAEAIVTLASNSDDNCVAIAREGAIPPLVTLLRSESDMHKQEATYALGTLAANNAVNRAKIAREGAIPPLVAFVRAATDAQTQWAVYALGFLSLSNEENRVLIAQEGAVPPLVELLRTGTQAQKQWSAYTLGNLAHNDENRVEITREGAVTPLIELLRSGTEMQKQRAAFALGNLACDNDVAMDVDEAILPLVELVRSGSDTQKEDAAYTLGNLAANNIDRRAEIGRKGAIPPLVQLLKSGNEDQKQWAAFALRCVAYENDANRVAIVEEGAIAALAELVEEGSEEEKELAAHALKHLVSKKDEDANIDGYMSPLMGYLRAGVTSQNANVAAALNTLGTVRDRVSPLFHRLVKSYTDAHQPERDPADEKAESAWKYYSTNYH